MKFKKKVFVDGKLVYENDEMPILYELCKQYRARIKSSKIEKDTVEYYLEAIENNR